MEGADELFGLVLPVGIEMEALTFGVDAGVGAAAALDLDRL